MSAGAVKCRVCSCTEERACNPPCAWFDESLCTTCALIVEALASWRESANRANWSALLRELARHEAANV